MTFSLPDTYHFGGTLRARTPEQTLAVIQPYIAKAGITRIANLTHLDTLGIPVYTCFRPLSKNLATSQGKGITDALAQCSAYMEGIEHYYSEQLVPALQHVPTSSDSERFITALPKGALRYTKAEKAVIRDWSVVHSLLTQKDYWAPTYYLNFDLSHAHIEDGLLHKTTTGLASGNNREEALCHALYEIIERHAMHRFNAMSYPKKLANMLALNSIDSPCAHHLVQHLLGLHIDMVIFNLPNPFNIPAYHCIIADENPFRKLGHYSGNGCHFDSDIALCRAITEAVQSRLTYIAGSRDDMFPRDYKTQWQPLKFTGTLPYRSHIKTSWSIAEQYQQLLASIQRQHYDPLALAHTAAQEAISVVHVIVPGLPT